jgi:hypothetical protein
MKRELKAGIAVTALVTAGAGVGVTVATSAATASTAAPQAKAHSETFISRDEKNIRLGKTGKYFDFSKDIEHGKVVGADSSSGTYNVKTGVVTARFSGLRPGGLIYGTFNLDTHSGSIAGTITGGLGKFKGVSGTVSGHAVNDKNSKVTLSYHR